MREAKNGASSATVHIAGPDNELPFVIGRQQPATGGEVNRGDTAAVSDDAAGAAGAHTVLDIDRKDEFAG